MHDTQTIQMVLTAVAAGALLVQSIFMIVIAVIALKAIRTVREELEEYRSAVMPIIDEVRPIVEKTRQVVDKVAPKVEEITAEFATITTSLREQTADLQVATNDIIGRTRRQASRVDGIMTSVLNGVERAGAVVTETVTKPMRQVSGLIASIKAVVESLSRQTGPVHSQTPRVVHARQTDGEHIPGPRPTGTTSPFHP